MNSTLREKKFPKWYWAVSVLGLLWNLFGGFQFFESVVATKDSLVSMGMTESQAVVMSNYPLWMTIAFGIGTLGGLIGSILLLIKNKLALPVFWLSLAGYIVLYIGDITEGIFAALGAPQVIILTTVVLIAAGLLWLAKSFQPTV